MYRKVPSRMGEWPVNEKTITYGQLFDVLESLGFQQKAPCTSPNHIFFHAPTETILAYGRQLSDPVTPADILSTEVHLHGRGVADEPLVSLVDSVSSKSTV